MPVATRKMDCQAHPLLGQAVQMRGSNLGLPVATKVPITEVVGQVKNDVGLVAGLRRGCQKNDRPKSDESPRC